MQAKVTSAYRVSGLRRQLGSGAARRRVRRAVFGLGSMAVLATLAASACGVHAVVSSPRSEGRMSWIVGVGELERLRALDPGLAGRVFDTPQTFALSAAGSPAGGFDRAVRTTSFGDENLLARAVSDGGLAQGTDAVIYDDEHWNLTPLAQQLHPSLYYHRAAEVAHRHGLLLLRRAANSAV